MGGNRTWTADELDYLAEKWGVIRPAKIGEKLGRSEGAVVQKASKLGLGPFLEAGGYVSLNQLLIAVTGTNAAYSYKMKSWVENRGLPVHTKRYRKNSWRVVYLDKFWKWAEKNKAFLDFSKMEPLALGAEPDWVAEQRRRDTRSNAVQRKDVWTPAEDDRLKLLLRQQRYSWSEIAHELNRSAGAIQRRIQDLGLKDRPVRADNHNPWSDQDFQTMADMLREGYSYGQIADAVGRSEKAVRGRVYDTYWTENADKVREMLKDGPWGYGKPEPTVWQAKNKYAVKKLLGRFDTLLRIRLNRLGYEPYWQKEMCLHWDDVKGCTAGEADCDSCVSFKRIPPQFCVRCGATFFERESHKVCVRCRKIRRWQAMKKNKSLTHKAEREGEDTHVKL